MKVIKLSQEEIDQIIEALNYLIEDIESEQDLTEEQDQFYTNLMNKLEK